MDQRSTRVLAYWDDSPSFVTEISRHDICRRLDSQTL